MRKIRIRAKTRATVALGVVAALVAMSAFYTYGRGIWVPVYQRLVGKETVASVVAKYGPNADTWLRPHFERARVDYPPQAIRLLALKEERVLELWASDGADYRLIREYRIEAASGEAGPKLREGDRQVPEGRYKIVGLNPNSRYHLSMKLNYPNAFDLAQAQREGRTEPGTDIFIHGKAVSIGCLAMGDRAIEELFVLTHYVGIENAEVLIAPYDPRERPLNPDGLGHPDWVPVLYQRLETEFNRFPKHSG